MTLDLSGIEKNRNMPDNEAHDLSKCAINQLCVLFNNKKNLQAYVKVRNKNSDYYGTVFRETFYKDVEDPNFNGDIRVTDNPLDNSAKLVNAKDIKVLDENEARKAVFELDPSAFC